MDSKKINIWNLDQEFELLCGRWIWNSFFGLNANNKMPTKLIEAIGIARQKAIEITSNVLTETNISIEEQFNKLLDAFWTSIETQLLTNDYEKAKSIQKYIDTYIIHGLDLGFDIIKNEINLDTFAKIEWLDIDAICNSVDKQLNDNFKNEFVKSLLNAIDVAGYEVENKDDLFKKIIMLVSDLNLFYINVCNISESIINDHGFVSMDVVENRILITYQNVEKVGSVYDITNNLIKTLNLTLKKEIID